MNAAGDRVAIGAPYNDGYVDDAGHVRIYQWQENNWVQIGADIHGEATDNLSGESVSLNAEGNRVAIGARLNDGDAPPNHDGHVRVYERDESFLSH